MKATGIVRRIDELGRVVIPKELRRTLKMREGEELEVFTDENNIILKKYSSIKEMNTIANEYTKALFDSTSLSAIVTDMDRIVSFAGNTKKYRVEDEISYKLHQLLNERKSVLKTGADVIALSTEDVRDIGSEVISPIIKDGDVVGGLILVSEKVMGESCVKIASIGSTFLALQI